MAQLSKVFFPYDPLPAQDLNDIVGFMNGIATGVNLEDESVTARTLAQSAKPQFWMDTIVLSASGTTSYTDCPFRPRAVIVRGQRTSGGAAITYDGVAVDTGSSISQEGRSVVTSGSNLTAVTVIDSGAAFFGTGSSGDTEVRGVATSMTSNGVSINVTTPGVGTTARFTVLFLA